MCVYIYVFNIYTSLIYATLQDLVCVCVWVLLPETGFYGRCGTIIVVF